MIVVVTGSRKLVEHPDKAAIKADFLREIEDYEPDQVFHGGAGGPDAWAAFEFPDLQRQFNPRDTPGRTPAQRLFDRNQEMILSAIEADPEVVVVACWDGVSKGTKHAMDFAESEHITVLDVMDTRREG